MPEARTVRKGYEADYTFQVDGQSTDELKVTSFTGHEAISELFSFRADLCSDNGDIDFAAIVGKACVLEIHGVSGSRYVNGMVRRFERLGEGTTLAHYAAEIVPVHWLLTKRHKSRIFQELNVPDIVKKVLTDAGTPTDAFRLALQKSYTTREYTVQYRESDFNFIARLLEEEGIFFFFEHTAEGHVMVIADSGTAHKTIPNAETIAFRDRSSLVADQDKEVVYALRERQDVQIGAVMLDDFNFKKPATDLMAQTQAGEYTSLEFSDYPGRYAEKSDGTALVKTRIEEFQASKRVQQMDAGVRALMPGFKFMLEEHPVEALNREYIVTRLTHHGIQPQSGQEEDIGSRESRGLEYNAEIETLWSETPFRPARRTPRPTVLGSQTALVVGPAGEEIYTDKYGRVKVQFHWDREGKMDDKSSCWIRVSEAWAGAGFGSLFLPRIGQEVVVDFLEGDPDRPLITGRVYNNDHMPAYTLPDEKTKSYIRSTSSKGGGGSNEIRFEDKKGEEQFFQQAEKNWDVRVKNEGKEWIGASRHLIVGGDQLEKVGGDKHLTVTGDQNEKIDGTVSQKIGTDLQQKVGGGHAVDASDIHLKGSMTVVVEAGMDLTLKGPGGFIRIDAGGVTIYGAMVKINSGGSAGSGSGCSPDAPKEPAEADRAPAGEHKTYSATPVPYGPQAAVLAQASEEGTPFAEKCAEPAPPPPAQRVKGTPTPILPTSDSIVCRNGKLELQINDTGPDKACTVAHEQSHVADWKARYGDDLCKGVPDGSLPLGGAGYAEFLRQSECKAYKVGKECREKMIKTADAKDKPTIQAGIDRDNTQLKDNKC